jgi:predicted membrane channel-forming protein YqfA (hemolysin III family)
MPIEMNYLELPISVALGFVAPFVISFLKQTAWSLQIKLLLAFAVSAVFGAAAAYSTGALVTEDYVGAIGVVFTVSNLFYQSYFANTPINTRLENVGLPKPDSKIAPIIPADKTPDEVAATTPASTDV